MLVEELVAELVWHFASVLEFEQESELELAAVADLAELASVTPHLEQDALADQ